MSATFEQAYAILNTLNIDIKEFNNYLNDILNNTNDDTKKNINNNNKNTKISFLNINTNKKWGDYDDDDDFITEDIKENDEDIVNDEKEILIDNNTIKKEHSFANIVSKYVENDPTFQQVCNKTTKKSMKNTCTNPMLQDYGLENEKKVYTAEDMSIVIKQKLKLGVDFQIDYDSLCPTMMNGLICDSYCNYVHLHRCKYEKNKNTCLNSKCNFLHSRDMPNSEAKFNFKNQ